MPTLILPPRLNEDCDTVRRAAGLAGWEVYAAPGWHLPPELADADPVIYADPLFADVAAAQLGLRLIDPPLDWLTQIPDRYLGRRVLFTTLRAARQYPTAPFFVKPADDKSFPARVYASPAELPGDDALPPETPVLISEPVHWSLEIRCFVLDRRLCALSPYLRHGELARSPDGEWPISDSERQEALGTIAAMLDDDAVPLPPAVVIDIGIIDGHGWALIEANAAWGSGIYGCDPAAVLPVLRRATIPGSAITADDSRWLRPAVHVER